MKAKYLAPGAEFTVDPPDPECPVRVCLSNDPEDGIRWGFPGNSRYWCYVGEDVEVDVTDEKIKDAYTNGECPDCGDPIPVNMINGGECTNCGHVFYVVVVIG